MANSAKVNKTCTCFIPTFETHVNIKNVRHEPLHAYFVLIGFLMFKLDLSLFDLKSESFCFVRFITGTLYLVFDLGFIHIGEACIGKPLEVPYVF